MHQFTLPLLKNSANPEKNIRDVFIGYFAVFVTFIIVGSLGYVGFTGKLFDDKADKITGKITITENYISLFDPDAWPAILVRFVLCI